MIRFVDSDIDFNNEGANKILEELKKDTEDIKNMFSDIEFVMDIINGDYTVWKGKSQESFYESYKGIESNFSFIGESLDKKNDFLRITIENYENGEKKIDSNIEEKSEDLDVN